MMRATVRSMIAPVIASKTGANSVVFLMLFSWLLLFSWVGPGGLRVF